MIHSDDGGLLYRHFARAKWRSMKIYMKFMRLQKAHHDSNKEGSCLNKETTFLIYIYKTQSLSVCMSAIEIKLETFRYKQTYESYITFSREAKYGILISIRIVYGGLRAYIYSTDAMA